MNTAAMTPTCPRCGTPIPSEAPGGLCPKCVLLGAAAPSEGGASRRTEPPTIETVRAAFPQLEIIELVGQGGMGFVYAARQIRLDRTVALKLLPMAPNSDPSFVERFHREGRLLARLHHPHIVTVHDFGQTGGFCFLLMELVDGVNLRQAMRSGRFSPREALAIVPQICAALQYAHEQGVLHRDIKPENILLDSRGQVKIADFGIAKLVGERATDFTLTASGARLGTPHYMAPEQIESPSAVDHRADIYSLGVVFYELLTGELPLGRFAPPSAKTELDARVDEIVLRALAKERELRQQSAGEVKTQVEEVASESSSWQAGHSSCADPPDPPAVPIPASIRPFVLLALATLGVWLLAGLPTALQTTLVWLTAMVSLGPLGILAGVVLLGPVGGLVWLAWRHHPTLVLPFGRAEGDSMDRALRVTATGVLLVLATQVGLQATHLVGVVALAPRDVHGIGSLIVLAGLIAIGLGLRQRFQTEAPSPHGVAPPFLTRVGWLFLAAGGVGFLPTAASWTSPMRVWHAGSLLGLVGVAALTRSRIWRQLALATCWMVLVVTGLTPFFVATPLVLGATTPSAADPGIPARIEANLLLWLVNELAFVAGIVLLNRRDVKAAFGIAPAPPPIAVVNPWPHRLFWLVVSLIVLPGSAVLTSWQASMMHRSLEPRLAWEMGMLPFWVGIFLFGLFWWTRPTTAAAPPPSRWNPWPKRIFWTLVLVVVLPASLWLLYLIVPQVVRQAASPLVPVSRPIPGRPRRFASKPTPLRLLRASRRRDGLRLPSPGVMEKKHPTLGAATAFPTGDAGISRP